MKTILMLVAMFVGCGGCIGAPFTLEESDQEPVGEAVSDGPAEAKAVYPSPSAVVPKPPPKVTRPAPGQGRSR